MTEQKTEVEIPTPPIEVQSPSGRISLRQFSMEDVEEMYYLIDRNREFVDQYRNDTSTHYPDLEHAKERTLHPPNSKRLRFGIRTSVGVLVGSINLTPDDEETQKGEIGYYLGEEFIGHGYATEAVNVLDEFAYNNGYTHLWAHVDPDNKPSQRVLERAGYFLTQERDEKGDHVYKLEHP